MAFCAKRTDGWCKSVSTAVCIAHSGVVCPLIYDRTERVVALKTEALSEAC